MEGACEKWNILAMTSRDVSLELQFNSMPSQVWNITSGVQRDNVHRALHVMKSVLVESVNRKSRVKISRYRALFQHELVQLIAS
jgi:hypothetical protein